MKSGYSSVAVCPLAFIVVLLCFCCSGCSSRVEAVGEKSLAQVANLIRVPLTRQSADYTCGITAVQSLIGYYGIDKRQDQLITAMQPDPDKGTDYRNIIAYLQSLGFSATARTNISLDELKGYLDNRQPVLLAIQAWADVPADWSSYENGHYVIAVGYDQDVIYFMDPSTLGNYTYIPATEFLQRWHDHDSYQNVDLIQFGIIASKATADLYNPDRIKELN